MDKQKLDRLEEEVLKRKAQRDKKRKPRMKVSGAGVKNLQKILTQKIK